MPIEKVRVQHKFGIISHYHRHELLERMSASSNTRKPYSKYQPSEITHDFISSYNKTPILDRKNLDIYAYQLLARIKRRAGLQVGGAGVKVNIPRAWVELCLLARCEGKIKIDVLKSLVASLQTAFMSVNHVPSLFLIAETVLDWIKQLPRSEPTIPWSQKHILTYNVAKFCFWRIYFHSAVYNLQGCDSFLMDLNWHLENLDFIRNMYCQYPDGELLLRHVSSIKRITVGLVNSPHEIYKTMMGQSLLSCLEFYQSVRLGHDLNKSLGFLLSCLSGLGTEQHMATQLCWECLTAICKKSLLSLQIVQTAAAGSLPLEKHVGDLGLKPFSEWNWVLATQYIAFLCEIAMFGSTSEIQKSAITAGTVTGVRVDAKAVTGYGLFDLTDMIPTTPFHVNVIYALKSALVYLMNHTRTNSLRETVANATRLKLQKIPEDADDSVLLAFAESKAKCSADVRSLINSDFKDLFQNVFDLLADFHFPRDATPNNLKSPRRMKKDGKTNVKQENVDERSPQKQSKEDAKIASNKLNPEAKSSGYGRIVTVLSQTTGQYYKVMTQKPTYPARRPESYESRNRKILTEVVKDQWYKELMEVFQASENAQKSIRECEELSEKEATEAELFVQDLDLNKEEVCAVLHPLMEKS